MNEKEWKKFRFGHLNTRHEVHFVLFFFFLFFLLKFNSLHLIPIFDPRKKKDSIRINWILCFWVIWFDPIGSKSFEWIIHSIAGYKIKLGSIFVLMKRIRIQMNMPTTTTTTTRSIRIFEIFQRSMKLKSRSDWWNWMKISTHHMFTILHKCSFVFCSKSFIIVNNFFLYLVWSSLKFK